MASEDQTRGTKRSKAFYRKSAYGNKKHCQGPTPNVLLPGIRGFLVMCNHDERGAVRESYNILNEYADRLYGPDKNAGLVAPIGTDDTNDNEDDCDDIEKALKKEVEDLKTAASAPQKRFQNVATKAKNCVFIRTSLENPMEVTSSLMEDIAKNHLKKARHAARIIPILGTCKANTKDIESLASDILVPIFSKDNVKAATCVTILFKMRNNNGTSCGRESVIPAITNVVKAINSDIKFSWTDYNVAIIVEVVCTMCCLGVAPDYFRLRKYNLQELQQGPKENASTVVESNKELSDTDKSVKNESNVDDNAISITGTVEAKVMESVESGNVEGADEKDVLDLDTEDVNITKEAPVSVVDCEKASLPQGEESTDNVKSE